MANNPDLEKKYEKEIANMKVCDEKKIRRIEGNGDKLIAKGWSIDKDGNISSWTIRTSEGKRPKSVASNNYIDRTNKTKTGKKDKNSKKNIVGKTKNKAQKNKRIDIHL